MTNTFPTPADLPPRQVSLGRIVHYRLPHAPASAGETECLAAIVTKVNADGTVNLQVFSSTSGTYFPQRVTEGNGKGQWCWPPLV